MDTLNLYFSYRHSITNIKYFYSVDKSSELHKLLEMDNPWSVKNLYLGVQKKLFLLWNEFPPPIHKRAEVFCHSDCASWHLESTSKRATQRRKKLVHNEVTFRVHYLHFKISKQTFPCVGLLILTWKSNDLGSPPPGCMVYLKLHCALIWVK
jgi:hypothetical protein